MNGTVEIGLILASLLFYADFDSSFDTVYSKGVGKAVIEADRYEPRITKQESGRFGEAAEFSYEDLVLETVWTKDVVRYPAKGNFPYKSDKAFDGTIGMWLQVDMEQLKKRSLIWLDPVHLLSSKNMDTGKIWMDFVTRELPDTPIFRFGPSHSRKDRKTKEEHYLTIPHIDFMGGEWHHVAGTWKGINGSGNACAVHLYFDGKLVGEIEGFDHYLDWNIDDWEIRIGLAFKGLIDDFFILDRFLSAGEIEALYRSNAPLGEFLGLDKIVPTQNKK